MSHKNKDTSSLPQVFKRLGSSTSSHRNTRQPDSRRAPTSRFDPSSTVDSSSYKLPNYSAISRMDNDVLHYSSPAQNNNSTFQPQQQQQQQQIVSSGSPPPVQNVFNFVKKGQLQEQTSIPISFVNPTTANNSMNNNIHNRGGINFVNNNSFNQVQPMHHFQPVQNETPMLPQQQLLQQQQLQHQHQNQHQHQHQQQYQQQQQQQHQHQQWVGTEIVNNNNNTNSFTTSKKEDRAEKPSNDIAKGIKIVASVPKDSDTDSDDNTSRGSTDRKRTKSSRKVIYQSSSKRTRSSSRERSPISNRKETSPSSRKRRTSDDRASSSRSAATTSSKVHVRKRPRRRTPPNHDDSDEMLAPFFDLKGDFYVPDYYTDSSSDESEEERDINSRLSKRNLPIEKRNLEEPEAKKDAVVSTTSKNMVWTNGASTAITEKPVSKTSAASILASGPLPPSKKFTAPNASSPATSPTIASSKLSSSPPLPLSKKFTPADAASVVMTPSGPLPLSRKFTAPATVQTASGPLPLSKKFTTPATSTIGTKRTSDSSPAIQAKKSVTPISHKIITASNTIVPPNSSFIKDKNGATSEGRTSERKTSDADKTITKVNATAAAATATAAPAATNTTAAAAAAMDASRKANNNDNNLSPIEKNGLDPNMSSAEVTTSASAVKNGMREPSGELHVSNSDATLSLDRVGVNKNSSAPTTANTTQIESNADVATDKNGDAVHNGTSKKIKEEISKDLPSQIDIKARNEVVMDTAPSLHTSPKSTADSNNNTGRDSDNITLSNKSNNPKEAVAISQVKQEPIIPQLKIETLNGAHVDKNIVSSERELPQVFQQAWESITQSPICYDGGVAQDENSSTSTSPTTTNSVAENDPMDVEPSSLDASPPPSTNAVNIQEQPTKPNTTITPTTQNATINATGVTGKRRQRKPGVPAPWKVRIGDDLEFYYLNTVTGETTKDRPV